MEDRLSIAGDGDAGAGEADGTSVVIEEANGEDSISVELQEDVGLTDGGGYYGQVKLTDVSAGGGAVVG